jgi:hypothetical protein
LVQIVFPQSPLQPNPSIFQTQRHIALHVDLIVSKLFPDGVDVVSMVCTQYLTFFTSPALTTHTYDTLHAMPLPTLHTLPVHRHVELWARMGHKLGWILDIGCQFEVETVFKQFLNSFEQMSKRSPDCHIDGNRCAVRRLTDFLAKRMEERHSNTGK